MRWWAAVSTGFAALVLLGCAGRSDNSGNTGASSFQELKLVSWGSQSGSPPGAPCDSASFANTFDVSAASGALTWDLCEPTMQGIEHQTGSYSLDSTDLGSINDAVSKLKHSSRQSCGADAPALTVDETTREGVQLLADDFYSGCPWGPLLGRSFVEGIANLEGILQALKDK